MVILDWPGKPVPKSIKLMPKDAVLALYKQEDEDSDNYICKLCSVSRLLKSGGGYTNWRTHFKSCPGRLQLSDKEWDWRWRKFFYAERDVEDNPVSSQAKITMKDHFNINPNAICLKLLIFDAIPFSLFESPHFKRGFKITPPSRNTLKKDLFTTSRKILLAAIWTKLFKI